jgi:hypothetical protein
VTWRGCESQSEALDVIDRIVEGMNLELAAIARAGIDFANGHRATEQAPDPLFQGASNLGERGVARPGRSDGHRPSKQ